MTLPVALVPLSSAAGQFACYSWKNVVVSYWFGHLTLDALATHDTKLEALCTLHPQGISTVEVVLPGRFVLPSPEVREALSHHAKKYAEHVVATTLILLGNGFWASAVRGAVTAVSMVSRGATKPHVFGAPREAADWLAPIHLERTGVVIDAEELATLVESGQRAHAQRA